MADVFAGDANTTVYQQLLKILKYSTFVICFDFLNFPKVDSRFSSSDSGKRFGINSLVFFKLPPF